MFATKVDGPSEAVRTAAERLFATMTGIMDVGVEAGAYDAGDVEQADAAAVRDHPGHLGARHVPAGHDGPG